MENYLSKRRHNMFKPYLNKANKELTILDFGSSDDPKFLTFLTFKRKIAVNPKFSITPDSVECVYYNAWGFEHLPFEDKTIDIITCAAVLEHFSYALNVHILSEFFRILKKDGVLLITTPHRVSHPLLFMLSRIGMLSKIEIDEHIWYHTHTTIFQMLWGASFHPDRIRIKPFQLGLNIYVEVRK